jgi:hypothetical protein
MSNPGSTSLAGKPGAGERGIGQNVKPDFLLKPIRYNLRFSNFAHSLYNSLVFKIK